LCVCVCVCVLTGPVSQHSEMNAECFTSPGRTLRNTVTHTHTQRERERAGAVRIRYSHALKTPGGRKTQSKVCVRGTKFLAENANFVSV